MREREGELTYHARLHEGNTAVYMCVSDGQVILMDQDRVVFRESPYVNKYGETFNSGHKKWDNFYLDEENGGK